MGKDEDLYEFMDFVGRLAGDIVLRIVEASWPAQSVYVLTEHRYDELDGSTLVAALNADDVARRF